MTLVCPAAETSFLQQIWPVVAALGTLLGVSLTLMSEARKNRLQRVDAYLGEQRKALAGVILAAQLYRRAAEEFEAVELWPHIDQGRATALRVEVDDDRSDLLNQLTVARLIIHQTSLQPVLDDVFKQWRAIGSLTAEIFEALHAGSQDVVSDRRRLRENAWADFTDAIGELQNLALAELAPTISFHKKLTLRRVVRGDRARP